MPMLARDSLVTLRSTQKNNSHLPTPKKEKRKLPLDELKAKVQAKRQRTEVEGAVQIFNSLPNRNDAIDSHTKRVRFDLNRNVMYMNDTLMTEEDLANAWISAEDQDRIRRANLRTIAAFRSQRMDQIDDCLRGLELHSSPQLVEKKLQNGRQFCACILEQQAFLRGLMGRANEMILGRMSSVLSAEDTKEAEHTAQLDAREASIIYAESLVKGKPLLQESTTQSEIASAATSETSADFLLAALVRS